MDYRPNRRETQVTVRLTVDDLLLETSLLDISRDGAKIACPEHLLPGTAVRLWIDGVEVKALVHWSRKGHAGLRFFDRLDSATLLMVEKAGDRLAAFR